MENVNQHGSNSNGCPKCQVPPEQLGSRAGHPHARDHGRYERYERENRSLDYETHDAAQARYRNETRGIKRLPNIFLSTRECSLPDLHKPDMLHIIYLRLIKDMNDGIQGFLKK